jgi:MFS transporter, MHS family, shikimate and dehydroshikimate transport protein
VIGARMAEIGLGYLYLVFGLSYVTTTLGVSRGITIVGIMVIAPAEIL